MRQRVCPDYLQAVAPKSPFHPVNKIPVLLRFSGCVRQRSEPVQVWYPRRKAGVQGQDRPEIDGLRQTGHKYDSSLEHGLHCRGHMDTPKKTHTKRGAGGRSDLLTLPPRF